MWKLSQSVKWRHLRISWNDANLNFHVDILKFHCIFRSIPWKGLETVDITGWKTCMHNLYSTIPDSQHDIFAISYDESCVVTVLWSLIRSMIHLPSTMAHRAWYHHLHNGGFVGFLREKRIMYNETYFSHLSTIFALLSSFRGILHLFSGTFTNHTFWLQTPVHIFFLSNHNKHTSCLPCVRKSILEKDEWMQSVNISYYWANWNYLCYGFVITMLWHYYVYMCFYRIFSGVLKWRRIKFAKRGNHFPPPYASCSQRGASFLLPANFRLRIWRSGRDLLRNLAVAVTIGSCFDHLPMLQPLVLASSIGSW